MLIAFYFKHFKRYNALQIAHNPLETVVISGKKHISFSVLIPLLHVAIIQIYV